MERFHKIRTKVIVCWIVTCVLGSIVALIFDTLILQIHALFFLEHYTDLLMTIWQVQASVSALTLTATAFIIGQISTTYYGVCIKDLLHNTNGWKKLWLSFWESIIVVLLLIPTTGLFVFLNNLFSVSIVFLASLYLTISITRECISVITESNRYIEQAKRFFVSLVERITERTISLDDYQILTNNTIDHKYSDKSKEIWEDQFQIIIEKFSDEIIKKIKEGIDLQDDPFFTCYRRIIKIMFDENNTRFFPLMHQRLKIFLNCAKEQESDKNVATIVNSSLSTTNSTNVDVLDFFLTLSYAKYITPRCFNNVLNPRLESISHSFSDPFFIALSVIKQSIRNLDKETFRKALRSVIKMQHYKYRYSKGSILLISIGYLYYLAFKDREFKSEKGTLAISDLRSYISEIIIEDPDAQININILNLLPDTQLLFSNLKQTIDYLTNHKNGGENNSANSKSFYIDFDFYEFVTFVLMAYYDRNVIKFTTLDMNAIIEIRKRIQLDGRIEDVFHESFLKFCSWVISPFKAEMRNPLLLISLSGALKEKIIEKARSDRVERLQNELSWLNHNKEILMSALKESAVYIAHIDQDCKIKQFTYEEVEYNTTIVDEPDFSYAPEYIRGIFEKEVFNANKQNFDSYILDPDYENPEKSFITFKNIISDCARKGRKVNQSYNHDFFYENDYSQFTDKTRILYSNLKSGIVSRGSLNVDSDVAIYIDTNIYPFGFSFELSNFLSLKSELSDAEIESVLERYKVGDSYIYHGNYCGVNLEYTPTELRELLKISLFKFSATVSLVVSSKKLGFYTKRNSSDLV